MNQTNVLCCEGMTTHGAIDMRRGLVWQVHRLGKDYDSWVWPWLS